MLVLGTLLTLGFGQVPEAREHIKLRPGPLVEISSGSVLGGLERELTSLHQRLRPHLLEVVVPVVTEHVDGTLVESEVLLSGVVIGYGGLFVAPVLPVREEFALEVTLADGRRFSAHSLPANPIGGLGLFRAPELRLAPPAFAMGGSIPVGSVAVTLGNAFGLNASLDLGFVAGRDRRLSGAEGLLQLTNTMNPGDGGGLVADRQGRIIGVLMTSLRESACHQLRAEVLEEAPSADSRLRSESLTFAIPIEKILHAFRNELGDATPMPPRLGVYVDENFEIQQRKNLPPLRMLRILDVIPGSPAALAGVLPEDRLVRLGGCDLGDLECLREALSLSKGPTPLVIQRAGEALELVVDFQSEIHRILEQVESEASDR